MRVKALGSINSGQYHIGDEFDATEHDAESLVASGAVCLIEEPAPEVSPPREKKEGLVGKARAAKAIKKGGKK